MDIRGRTCIGHHRTPARPDTASQGTTPSGHWAIAPPGRRHEATRHHTEKDCGERRKDYIMRCRRGGTPRGSRTVVFLYGYIVTYGYIFVYVPPDNRITTPPGRVHEATRYNTEKNCGERRKDHIMRCRRGGTPRGSRTVVFLYGYIVTYGYIVADVPRDNRITAPPRRRHEAMRHKTEKECGERRKDRRMRHDGRRHNAMRHGPARLGSPPPGVPRLPTARRASAPHHPSCATVWHPEGPLSAMPRPNTACSRRRQPLCTNTYSFVWPWRFIMARSAARLRLDVGPLASRKAVAGQSRQRDIIGNNRTYSEHIPGISGHFRAYSGHFRASSDTRGSSCAVSSVAGSHAVVSVAAGMARRRIACDQARCVRYRSVPGTASRRGVACDTARRGEWASRAVSPLAGHGVGDGRRVPYRLSPDRVRYGPSLTPVSSHPGPLRRPHVPAVPTVGRAEHPSSAMPRPNIRL